MEKGSRHTWWSEGWRSIGGLPSVKAITKAINRVNAEGTIIVNVITVLFNSKNVWHQPEIIRTTILQGGAEMIGAIHPCSKGRKPSAKSCPKFCFKESFRVSEISIL